jgi:predicted helicase
VARELYALEETFFTGKVKHETLKILQTYYAAIKSAAALVTSHHEKQNFLKVIYENFYKVYDKKKADRLGVIYTPNEIVRFMIESADWLCQKHFGKALIDKNVEILDPAAGTGTFITELIEHFRGQPAKLRYKYLEELHANEVAILPYYVANLNIEATYATVTGAYEEYPNLCFVDTLDNTAALRAHKGQQGDLFGALSEENVARIKRQNKKKISVIIGNPPYNANQLNENENNKNRKYPEIDKRIKETYIKASTAQKTKLYDMFVRFFRWASDRVDENGIVAFVTNRSFIDKRNFDGFRKAIPTEFRGIYVVDLGGDWKLKGVGGGGNVFGIGTGVAVSFLIKEKSRSQLAELVNYCYPPYRPADEKRAWLGSLKLQSLKWTQITPDQEGYWIDQPSVDAKDAIPVASKIAKKAKVSSQAQAIFRLFSLGVATNRDEWVYDQEERNLCDKVAFFINFFNAEQLRWSAEGRPKNTSDWVSREIKWTSELEARLTKGVPLIFSRSRIRRAAYRPFCSLFTYYDHVVTHRPYQQNAIFPILNQVDNRCIMFTDPTAQKPWLVSVVSSVPDLHYVGGAAGSVCLPRFQYSESTHIDNITDWALEQFRAHYEGRANTSPHPEGASKRTITKDAIFHYVYGVLHDPLYREKYAQDLKREFPRIPFYADFWKWADWGEKLMALHIGYETVEPWPLARIDASEEKSRQAGLAPKALLRANKEGGNIQLDTETQLTGVPPEAWSYKLGNRSALEWILDQYKERTPKDPTVREKFNTYRFADHREKVIDLLKRVSVETMKIVEGMRAEKH